MHSCVRFEVQRCQYCVGDADTLEWMVKMYGLQTNWLRLWALNSDQDGMSKPEEEVCACIFERMRVRL